MLKKSSIGCVISDASLLPHCAVCCVLLRFVDVLWHLDCTRAFYSRIINIAKCVDEVDVSSNHAYLCLCPKNIGCILLIVFSLSKIRL